MDRARWERAKQVFFDAIQASGAERTALVDAACGGDAKLRDQVSALLRGHEDGDGFLSAVTIEAPPARLDAPAGDPGLDHFADLQAATAGRYSLEGELGRGGMGVVYLARDVSLDRLVAIKLLSTEVGGRREARERFLREARNAAGLSHPNIVPVHSVEEQGDLVFFVMGFIEGETVRERVRRAGAMPVAAALRMVQEVAWALGHAHGRGVIHRDVKPDNIILEKGTGRAVVTDFGISRAEGPAALTGAHDLLGTPEYVSPEQGMGEEVDARSDIYSLGVTSFYALTGQLPFEAKTVHGVIAKHVNEPPPSLSVLRPDAPRRLARAVDRCLEKDPAARFGTGEELAEALSQARSQVVEVSAPIAAMSRQIELLIPDALGWGAISATLFVDWVILGDDPTLEWGIKIGVYLLGVGLVAARAAHIVTAARSSIAQGFGVGHLREARRESSGATGRVGPPHIGKSRPLLEFCGFLVAWVALTLLYMFATGDGSNPVQGALRPIYFFAMMGWNIIILMLPVLAGRAFGARVVGAWTTTRRLWSTVWTGRIADWVFSLAGVGLRKRQGPKLESRPTEALVAGVAAHLFGSLPTEYRNRLDDLPDVVCRLESAANALREREAELEQALAAVGAVGSSVDRHLGDGKSLVETGAYESVQAHRAEVGKDLDDARIETAQRLAATIAALENLRLGLLRLRAGVGTPEELTSDLRAARELGERVQSLLEGKREVDELLG